MLSALVIDSDRADVEQAGDALAAAGFAVSVASDMAEALAAPASRHPDLVVCDVSGPGQAALFAALRASGLTATFIATSSDPTPEVRRSCQAAGATVCLAKPVNTAALVAIASQLLTHGHLSDPGESPPDAELLDRIRAKYLELLPTRAAAVRDTADLPGLARVCHTLSGASAQFGYPGLAELCRGVEQGALAGRRDPELVELVLAAARHIQGTSR
ncbi:MAG TPA: response regulator [Dermatophilaceae bacterium]|nr:response regulator [Dermatophilaceae bacterium]